VSRSYENPPLIEALCQFNFEPSQPWDWTIPGLVYAQIESSFPKKRQQNVLEVLMQPKEEPVVAPKVKGGIAKMQFLNEDETALIQVGPDMLAVNHVRPYPKWPAFKRLIFDHLRIYSEVAKPKGLRRIGLRYINRIVLPHERISLEDYFRAIPQVPDSVPQDYRSLMLQLEIPFREANGNLRLSFGSVAPETPGTLAFMFDLDFFTATTEGITIESAADWVETAHTEIENTFISCFTETTHQEIFKEIKS